MEKKICAYCGYQNHPDFNKCQKCGKDISGTFNLYTKQNSAMIGQKHHKIQGFQHSQPHIPMQTTVGSKSRIAIAIFVSISVIMTTAFVLFFTLPKTGSVKKNSLNRSYKSYSFKGLWIKKREKGIGKKGKDGIINVFTNVVAPDYSGYLIFKFHLNKVVPKGQEVNFKFRKMGNNTPISDVKFKVKGDNVKVLFFYYNKKGIFMESGLYKCTLFSPSYKRLGSIYITISKHAPKSKVRYH